MSFSCLMILQDELMTGCGDGRFMEKRYFFCQDDHGFFCSVSDIQPLEPTAGGAPMSTRAAPGPINCEYN